VHDVALAVRERAKVIEQQSRDGSSLNKEQ
jgi:hypothetical protein